MYVQGPSVSEAQSISYSLIYPWLWATVWWVVSLWCMKSLEKEFKQTIAPCFLFFSVMVMMVLGIISSEKSCSFNLRESKWNPDKSIVEICLWRKWNLNGSIAKESVNDAQIHFKLRCLRLDWKRRMVELTWRYSCYFSLLISSLFSGKESGERSKISERWIWKGSARVLHMFKAYHHVRPRSLVISDLILGYELRHS